jgi:hypothetical protein
MRFRFWGWYARLRFLWQQATLGSGLGLGLGGFRSGCPGMLDLGFLEGREIRFRVRVGWV